MADDMSLGRPRKTSKYEKGEGHKKRRREHDATEVHERKHKRSKRDVARENVDLLSPTQTDPLGFSELGAVSDSDVHRDKKKKRGRKKKDHNKLNGAQTQPQPHDAQPDGEEIAKVEKKHKRKESKPETKEAVSLHDIPQHHEEEPRENPDPPKEERRKKKKKSKRHESPAPEHSTVPDGRASHVQGSLQDNEATDVDSSPLDTKKTEVLGDQISGKKFPFYTQTISQYLPLYPSGMVEPIEGYVEQHFRRILNRYVPHFGGVLLRYRNPRIGEAPGRESITEESGMEDEALLESINEYAVTFGWLTVEVDLFRPTRGAWMEGSVNLQSEGHIGVVCWGKFNAAIEAGRLRHGWQWVDLLSRNKGKKQHDAGLPTPDPFEGLNEGEEEFQATGYWTDEKGARIRIGTHLYFRIKSYEVGTSGEYGYLSIEGTMLEEEGERKRVAEEMEAERRRKLRQDGRGLYRHDHKRLLELGMTKFGGDGANDGEEEKKS